MIVARPRGAFAPKNKLEPELLLHITYFYVKCKSLGMIMNFTSYDSMMTIAVVLVRHMYLSMQHKAYSGSDKT